MFQVCIPLFIFCCRLAPEEGLWAESLGNKCYAKDTRVPSLFFCSHRAQPVLAISSYSYIFIQIQLLTSSSTQCSSGHFSPSLTYTGLSGLGEMLLKGCQTLPHIVSNQPKMGQIWDFIRSVFSTENQGRLKGNRGPRARFFSGPPSKSKI